MQCMVVVLMAILCVNDFDLITYIHSAAGRPYDGQPNIETETVSVVLTVIFSLLATAGIVFAIVCLVFNITFRKKK